VRPAGGGGRPFFLHVHKAAETASLQDN